jgi:stage II sporulation protein M
LAGQAALDGISPLVFFAAFILPHGLAEIPAIVLASAFGLNLGLTLITPPRGMGFGSGLLLAGVEWLKIAWLVVPLLALAAFLEITLTPRVVAYFFGA